MKCLCFSQKAYSNCCEPYHMGQNPPTSLDLMRSRYSAYALNLPDYIMQTTHKNSVHYVQDSKLWRASIEEFSTQVKFTGLAIVEHKDTENKGTVTFIAHLMKNEVDVSFKEKSDFVRENGRWYYQSGVHEEIK